MGASRECGLRVEEGKKAQAYQEAAGASISLEESADLELDASGLDQAGDEIVEFRLVLRPIGRSGDEYTEFEFDLGQRVDAVLDPECGLVREVFHPYIPSDYDGLKSRKRASGGVISSCARMEEKAQ